MEGVGVAGSVIDLFRAIGPLAGAVILIVIAYFIIREVKKENERTRKSVEGLKGSFCKRMDDQDEVIKALEDEVKYIQKEYITKEDHYRDTEGWKTEIQGVRKDMGELPLKILSALKNSEK